MGKKEEHNLSWLRKSGMMSYEKRRMLDVEKLIDAVCYVNKTWHLFI